MMPGGGGGGAGGMEYFIHVDTNQGEVNTKKLHDAIQHTGQVIDDTTKKGSSAWGAFGQRLSSVMNSVGTAAEETLGHLQGSMMGGVLAGNILANVLTKAADKIIEFASETLSAAANIQRLQEINGAFAASSGVSSTKVRQLTEEVEHLGYTTSASLKLVNEMFNLGANVDLAPKVAQAAKIGAIIAGTDRAEATRKIVEAAETGMNRQLRSMQVFVDLNALVMHEETKRGQLMDEEAKQAFRLQEIIRLIAEKEGVAAAASGDIQSGWTRMKLVADGVIDDIAVKLVPAVQELASDAADTAEFFKDWVAPLLKAGAAVGLFLSGLGEFLVLRAAYKRVKGFFGSDEEDMDVLKKTLQQQADLRNAAAEKQREDQAKITGEMAQKERADKKRLAEEELQAADFLTSARASEFGGISALETERGKMLHKRYVDEVGVIRDLTASDVARAKINEAINLKERLEIKKTADEVRKTWEEVAVIREGIEKDAIKTSADHQVAALEAQAAQELIGGRDLEERKFALREDALRRTAEIEKAHNDRVSGEAIAKAMITETAQAAGNKKMLAQVYAHATVMAVAAQERDIKIDKDTNAAILALADELNNARLAKEHEFQEKTKQLEFDTGTFVADRQKTLLDAQKSRDLDALAVVDAQTVTGKIALVQRKLAIEEEYIQRRSTLELASIDRTHQHELNALNDEVLRGGTSAAEANRRRLAMDADYQQRRFAIQQDAQIQAEEAARKAAIEQYQQTQDHLRKQYDTLKQEAGGIFDALLQKGESVWKAIGNSLKTALLTAIKDVVTSQIAAGLLGLFTGASVKFQHDGGILGRLSSGNPVFSTGQQNPVAQVLSQTATPIAAAGASVVQALEYTAGVITATANRAAGGEGAAGLLPFVGGGTGLTGGFLPLQGGLDLAAGLSPTSTAAGGLAAAGGYTGPMSLGDAIGGQPYAMPGLAQLAGGLGITPPFLPSSSATTWHANTGQTPGGQGFQWQQLMKGLKGFVGFGDNVPNLPGYDSNMTGSDILGSDSLGDKASAIGQSPAAMMAGTLLATAGWNRRRTAGGSAMMAGGGALMGYSLGSKLGGNYGYYGAAAGAGAGIMLGGWSQGNLGESIGGGALAGAGVGTMIVPGLGTAIGAGVGALGGALGSIFGLMADPLTKVRAKIKSYWGLDVSNQSILQQIWSIIEQNYGKNIDLAMPAPEIRKILEMYAQMTGQKWAGRNTPGLNLALLQRHGDLQFGASTSDLGTLINGGYTSSAGIGAGSQAIVNSPVTGSQVVMRASLSLDGPTAAAFLQGQAVEAMGNNPRAVGAAVTSSYAGNYGRRENYASVYEPGLVTN